MIKITRRPRTRRVLANRRRFSCGEIKFTIVPYGLQADGSVYVSRRGKDQLAGEFSICRDFAGDDGGIVMRALLLIANRKWAAARAALGRLVKPSARRRARRQLPAAQGGSHGS